MTTIAIIPARGGSKRIPRKNILPFEGKPIIGYSIEAALQSRLFVEVMVSTEDEEIARIAVSFGARVPFKRSQPNAGDHATTVDVLLEVLEHYEKQGRIFDYGCCIYPTAPFVTGDLLLQGWQMMVEKGYDSVFPVLRYSHPIQRALSIQDGKVGMIWPENYAARSQDLPPAYHDAGQFYWFRTEALKLTGRLWTDNSGALLISEMQAHDIDGMDDWATAEFKYHILKGNHAK
jgi:N-acylneuraminate cytidylyltransferase